MGIHLDGDRGSRVVGNQHRLQHSLGETLLEQGNQGIRVAVAVRIGHRLLPGAQGAGGIAQHGVDQCRGVFLPLAIFLRQLHRLIDGGAFRNFVHFMKLIQPQVENVPHHGMQIGNLAGEQLPQIKV